MLSEEAALWLRSRDQHPPPRKSTVLMSLCQFDNCVKMKDSLHKQESPDCSMARALNQEAETSVDQVDGIAASFRDQVT